MPDTFEQVTGTLVSYKLYNEKWGRGALRLDSGETLIVTGEALAGLTEGNRYRLDGRAVHHPKFGTQFECRIAAIDLPLDEDALVRHLCKNFKGCGIATAKKMVAQYRDTLPALRDRLVRDPHALDFTAVTRRKIAVAGDSGLKTLIYRHFSTRLAAAITRDGILRKIAEWLAQRVAHLPDAVSAAWALFSRNPYAPMRDIDGYGFAAADQIALSGIGFPRFHECRLAALAAHALREACEHNGHVYLLREEVAERIARIDPDVCAETAIAAAQASKERIVIEHGRYYPSHLWHAERALALELAARGLRTGAPLFAGTEAELDAGLAQAEAVLTVPGRSFQLDASQRKAMTRILTSTHLIHTLTAGPGCGKTALMEILVQMAQDRKVLFCAPTGKAAKVLASRLQRHGRTATTIHAMLGAGNEGFEFNADNPLEADIVIADESSMDDLVLVRAMVSAVPPYAHIVFLGDVDQLPSIGPGQVLKDLLQLPFDHHRLTVTHRNDGGILEVVQQACSGQVDCERRPDVLFSRRIPMPDDVGVSRVVSAYLKAVGRFGIERVGLLMPRRKGDAHSAGWNTTYLNEVLRQARHQPAGRRPHHHPQEHAAGTE
jgi:exodeoxyribonuclease V alpha subunit